MKVICDVILCSNGRLQKLRDAFITLASIIRVRDRDAMLFYIGKIWLKLNNDFNYGWVRYREGITLKWHTIQNIDSWPRGCPSMTSQMIAQFTFTEQNEYILKRLYLSKRSKVSIWELTRCVYTLRFFLLIVTVWWYYWWQKKCRHSSHFLDCINSKIKNILKGFVSFVDWNYI